MERQIKNLENANAPQKEINLMKKASDTQNKLSKRIFKDYEKIINDINKQLKNTKEKPEKSIKTKKTIGDLQKEMRKNAHN